MDNNSVFRNRAYLVNDTKVRVGFEGEVLRRILSLESVALEKAELIDGTPDYDSYKIEGGNRFFNIKLSFDDASGPLLYERKILPDMPLEVGPKFLRSDKIQVGENSLLFLLSSWDNAGTITELGRGVLLDDVGMTAVSNLLTEMQGCKVDHMRTLEEGMADLFKLADIKSYFFDDSLEALDEYSDLEKIESLLRQLKTEITGSFDLNLLSGKGLMCHGGMGMNNLLFRGGRCKLRNFDEAFVGSQWLDVVHLVLDTGITGPAERQFVKHLESCIDEGDYSTYKQIKDFYSRVYLIRLAVAYLMEIYIFSSQRPSEIINLNTKFVQNFPVFHKIPTFKNNAEYISKLITEPILGFKA